MTLSRVGNKLRSSDSSPFLLVSFFLYHLLYILSVTLEDRATKMAVIRNEEKAGKKCVS
jgi:uncharacterized membrane protein YhhN